NITVRGDIEDAVITTINNGLPFVKKDKDWRRTKKEIEEMQALRNLEIKRKLEEDIRAWTVPMEYRIRTKHICDNYKKDKKVNKYYKQIIKKNILLDEKKNRVCK
ncbi:hypothetical protein RFI_36205, partial [Reticulomyxa filosa]